MKTVSEYYVIARDSNGAGPLFYSKWNDAGWVGNPAYASIYSNIDLANVHLKTINKLSEHKTPAHIEKVRATYHLISH